MHSLGLSYHPCKKIKTFRIFACVVSSCQNLRLMFETKPNQMLTAKRKKSEKL